MISTASWDDVIARVRGLSSRLMGRVELERLAASHDIPALVRALDGTAYAHAADRGVPTSAQLERDTRRVAGDRLTIITAWCGDRVEALAPLFEDEDRRNLRAINRGVASHAPADQRVLGLLPTPALPLAALEELAQQPRLQDVAATLSAWGNPYGRAMMGEAMRAHPDLFLVQLAIDREYAERTLDAAAHLGEPLEGYVRLQIDGENARIAIAASGGALEHDRDALFIPGGELITLEVFHDLAARTPSEARARLARIFGGTVLAPIVPESGGEEHESAMLTAMLRELRRTVRLNPLSLSVVLEYVLRLRAELQDLARIIWGITLQVPRKRIISRLVTP